MEQNVDYVVNGRCFSVYCSYNGRRYKPDVSKGIEYFLSKRSDYCCSLKTQKLFSCRGSVLAYSNGGGTDMSSQTCHVRGRHKVLKVLKPELHSAVSYLARTRFINTSCSLPNRLPTDFINIWTRSVLWSHMSLRDWPPPLISVFKNFWK
jgi:hypothetical protein